MLTFDPQKLDPTTFWPTRAPSILKYVFLNIFRLKQVCISTTLHFNHPPALTINKTYVNILSLSTRHLRLQQSKKIHHHYFFFWKWTLTCKLLHINFFLA